MTGKGESLQVFPIARSLTAITKVMVKFGVFV